MERLRLNNSLSSSSRSLRTLTETGTVVAPAEGTARQIFEDQYVCSGGQLHEVATGRDRFVVDLRPLVAEHLGASQPLVAHPYDVCTSPVLTELGGTFGVIARIGGTLDVMRADMDVSVSGLSWAGEALGDARAYVRLTDGTDPWVQSARAWEIGGAPTGEPCGSARDGFAHGRWPADPPLRTRDGLVPAL